MSQYGTFYVVTAKHGVRPNRLKKFLLQEWFTALQSASGCLDVELWESQRSRGRYQKFLSVQTAILRGKPLKN